MKYQILTLFTAFLISSCGSSDSNETGILECLLDSYIAEYHNPDVEEAFITITELQTINDVVNGFEIVEIPTAFIGSELPDHAKTATYKGHRLIYAFLDLRRQEPMDMSKAAPTAIDWQPASSFSYSTETDQDLSEVIPKKMTANYRLDTRCLVDFEMARALPLPDHSCPLCEI
ncbi:MAG: hypothetical protein AAGF87_16070 [Bacteroidota bacterium]